MSRDIRHWLFKSEPGTFSIADLAVSPKKTTCWDGVRNYQARNLLRDEIRKGDKVLFYHSSCEPAGVAGTAIVMRDGYPDFTALDKKSTYHDPKSTPENPIWYMVDIRLEQVFLELVTLQAIRERPELQDMVLLQKGSRLSVQPVSRAEFDTIVGLAAESRGLERPQGTGKNKSRT